MGPLSEDFQSFHKDRLQSNMNAVQKEYLQGKRVFDKYDIEDKWEDFRGLVLVDAQFSRCIIEVNFTNCNLMNTLFLECNLKTVSFTDYNLTNAFIDECSIESIAFKKSILEGIKFGTNYAYGVTLNSDTLKDIYLAKEGNTL
jgi:uncharacterized protein YjbI with pentapeptide repeats